MQFNIINNIIRPLKSIQSNMCKYIGYDKESIFTKFLEYSLSNIYLIKYDAKQKIINYDLYFHDKPEEFTFIADQINQEYLHSLVYVRNPPPHGIKKEDRFLIQQKLSKSHVVFQNENLRDSWFGNSNRFSILEYGIPLLDIGTHNRNSIIVLNYNQSHNLKLLYHNVKQNFPDAAMLESIDSMSYLDICYILQQYKVCITAGDNYNTLCAVANGCKVFSNDLVPNIEYTYFNDLNDIIKLIHKAVQDHHTIGKLDNIAKYYSIDNFNNTFTSILNNILRKPIIL